jgi:hypothetical protein
MSMQYYCNLDRFALTASSIEESKLPLLKGSEHIFLKEKAPWFDVPDDGLERHEGMPPVFEDAIQKWLKGRQRTE